MSRQQLVAEIMKLQNTFKRQDSEINCLIRALATDSV